MPQPIAPPKSPRGYMGGGSSLVQHGGECVAYIGAIAVAWTLVERQMTEMVSTITGLSWMDASGGYANSRNWVAHVAMGKAETIRGRIGIMEATVGELLNGSDLQARWEALRDGLTKRSKERNKVVRTNWATCMDFPGDMTEPGRDGQWIRWTKKDFEAVLLRIERTWGELLGFALEVQKALVAGQILHERARELFLQTRQTEPAVTFHESVSYQLVREVIIPSL